MLVELYKRPPFHGVVMLIGTPYDTGNWSMSPRGFGVDTEFWLSKDHYYETEYRAIFARYHKHRLPPLPMLHNERWFREKAAANAYASRVIRLLQRLTETEFAALISAGTEELREIPGL